MPEQIKDGRKKFLVQGIRGKDRRWGNWLGWI
jgi:hypothetical protein